ncbi:hypothetical protein M316_0011 [Nitrincola phage 1M3-16]|uniref:hypothetical protein n=1 Tax=Nitrincola phage 1M3-16 TaxID=1472912 RepID=UPI000444E245|nr:hypothetical protein GJ22_gp141 [Nitrincola phage 1M3-16]AHX01076.1 hypothetical protein M316_0011 [Nitrincola phage 1M3-16]
MTYKTTPKHENLILHMIKPDKYDEEEYHDHRFFEDLMQHYFLYADWKGCWHKDDKKYQKKMLKSLFFVIEGLLKGDDLAVMQRFHVIVMKHGYDGLNKFLDGEDAY